MRPILALFKKIFTETLKPKHNSLHKRNSHLSNNPPTIRALPNFFIEI